MPRGWDGTGPNFGFRRWGGAAGLETAEVGGGLVQDAVSLGAGAVDGGLLCGAEGWIGFGFGAALEAPRGAGDFAGEEFF
jgi:hypothetical protein